MAMTGLCIANQGYFPKLEQLPLSHPAAGPMHPFVRTMMTVMMTGLLG